MEPFLLDLKEASVKVESSSDNELGIVERKVQASAEKLAKAD